MKEKAEMSTARSFCSSMYKNMSRHSPVLPAATSGFGVDEACGTQFSRLGQSPYRKAHISGRDRQYEAVPTAFVDR